MFVEVSLLSLSAVSSPVPVSLALPSLESMLLRMASSAQGNQVVFFICSAFASWNDMMDFEMFVVAALLTSEMVSQKNIASDNLVGFSIEFLLALDSWTRLRIDEPFILLSASLILVSIMIGSNSTNKSQNSQYDYPWVYHEHHNKSY